MKNFLIKKRLITILLIGCNFVSVQITLAQNQLSDDIKCKDSIVKLKHPDGFNYIFEGKIIKGLESWTEGDLVNDIKVGIWKCYDKNNKLLGYRSYMENGDYIEIQIRRNRLLSIIKYQLINSEIKQQNTYKITNIYSFNRQGKMIYYENENGELNNM